MNMKDIKDYLGDIKLQQFPADMSIMEAAAETCMLAEANWVSIVETTALEEYNTFEKLVSEGVIEDTALVEANASSVASLKEKAIENFKKIASYLSGLVAKFIANLGQVFSNNKFLLSTDSIEKQNKGVANLEKEQADVDCKLVNPDFLQKISDNFDNATEYIDKIITSGKISDDFADKVRAKITDNGEVTTEKTFKEELSTKIFTKFGICKINAELLNAARKNFKEQATYKTTAKWLYNFAKNQINVYIAKFKSDNALDASKVADAIKAYNKGLSIISKAYGIILSALTADYTSCCKIMLKCQNAGGKTPKEEKEIYKDSKVVNPDKINVQSENYISESIESIFGLPAH